MAMVSMFFAINPFEGEDYTPEVLLQWEAERLATRRRQSDQRLNGIWRVRCGGS